MTVKQLRQELNKFKDSDEITFEVVLDGENRSTYYGNESMFMKDIVKENDNCVLHISGDVDDEE